MGIRRSGVKKRKAGVSGDGVPFGCLTTRRYHLCVVTFHCTSVYVCSPIAANIVRRGDTAIS
jgi:hypothetical protein